MKTFHMILQSTWFFPAPPFQVTRCTRSTNNESFPWPYDHAFNQTFQRIRSLSRQETRVGMFGWKEMRREQIQISPIKTKLQSIQAFKSLLIIGEIIYCAWKKKLRIYKRWRCFHWSCVGRVVEIVDEKYENMKKKWKKEANIAIVVKILYWLINYE